MPECEGGKCHSSHSPLIQHQLHSSSSYSGVNKVGETNRICILQLVFQTQKGVPTSKGIGLANPNPCKLEKRAQRFLGEKRKTVHLKKSLQSQDGSETKGTFWNNSTVLSCCHLKYRKGLRQSYQPGAHTHQHKLRRDPAEVDSLYRDVGTSPRQQFNTTLRCEGERLLAGPMKWAQR